MSVFDFADYKLFVKAWLGAQPRKGRGLLRKMAEHLRISSTMLSHIFSGDKHLSPESASDVAEFVTLSEPEFEYFLLLVLHGRAATSSLRDRLAKKIAIERAHSKTVAARIQPDVELSDVAKATFYSSWLYSGVRNLTACPGFGDVGALADHLHLPRPVVAKIVEFLLINNLCIKRDSSLEPGPQQTHVPEGSPTVNQHHRNWRVNGFAKMLEGNKDDLYLTAPMSLSEVTAAEIRALLLNAIAEVRKQVRPSTSETVRCLNIDWFSY